jgi:branched-chain amino acid transport system permease protein
MIHLRCGVLALCLVFAACSAVVDTSQLRVCRVVVMALNPADPAIDISRVERLREGMGLRLIYRVVRPGQPLRDRTLECQFTTENKVASTVSQLSGVTTEEGPLGEVRLALIRRFWLNPAFATHPAAWPLSNAATAREVPRIVAVVLQQVLVALPLITIYGLLATSYSLIYGLIGRINLAFGEIVTVGGYATFLSIALTSLGSGVLALVCALALSLVIAAAYGAAAGRFVFWRLRFASGQQALVATVGLAIFLQEFLRLTQGSHAHWLPPILNSPVPIARSGGFVVTVTWIALIVTCGALIAAVILFATLKKSRFGLCWQATADDPVAAALCGVSPARIQVQTFILASALAGHAGYIVTIYYGAIGFTDGATIGMKSLIAAIVGGIGSVPGAFVGGLTLGLVECTWSALFPLEYRDVIVYGLLVAVLIFRPSGLLGHADPLAPKTREGQTAGRGLS